jgi:hypothetical protein
MSRNPARSRTPGGDGAEETLRALFRRQPVCEMVDLRRELGTSERTVFRVLARIGYHSSFNHAGRYYALKDVPTFDEEGLWFQGQAGFSAAGTLRTTLERMVCRAPEGRTHEELAARVRLRVYDTLRDLVRAKLLGRELVEALHVYLDPAPEAAAAQVRRRRELLAAGMSPQAPVDLARVVDVLLAVIRVPGDPPHKIARALRARGLALADAQVEQVFERYGLEKKTASSGPRRSRR